MKLTNLKIEGEYKKAHKRFCKQFDSYPQFFKPQPLPKTLKKELESSWPKKHYEGAFYFEGWPFRDIISQAMHIGYELGKNPKKRKANEEKTKSLAKELSKFKFKVTGSKRDFMGVGIEKVEVDKSSGKTAIFYKNSSSASFTTVSLEDFIKAWKKWEKRTLKKLGFN